MISNVLCTVFPLIEAESQIQAGSLIEAGGLTKIVLIEAGASIRGNTITSTFIYSSLFTITVAEKKTNHI